MFVLISNLIWSHIWSHFKNVQTEHQLDASVLLFALHYSVSYLFNLGAEVAKG